MKPMKQIPCSFCGRKFRPSRHNMLYDSNACKQAAARTRRNLKRRELNAVEKSYLSEIYIRTDLEAEYIELVLKRLVGCHGRQKWEQLIKDIAALVESAHSEGSWKVNNESA